MQKSIHETIIESILADCSCNERYVDDSFERWYNSMLQEDIEKIFDKQKASSKNQTKGCQNELAA